MFSFLILIFLDPTAIVLDDLIRMFHVVAILEVPDRLRLFIVMGVVADGRDIIPSTLGSM
jgi:hypothetical protein